MVYIKVVVSASIVQLTLANIIRPQALYRHTVWLCMVKNMCGKKREVSNPYEVYKGPAGFEWRVLKKYQTPDNEAKNPYARWYCAVKSDYTYGSFEYGDVYISEIKENGIQVQEVTI